jgi:hypothetical protein
MPVLVHFECICRDLDKYFVFDDRETEMGVHAVLQDTNKVDTCRLKGYLSKKLLDQSEMGAYNPPIIRILPSSPNPLVPYEGVAKGVDAQLCQIFLEARLTQLQENQPKSDVVLI